MFFTILSGGCFYWVNQTPVFCIIFMVLKYYHPISLKYDGVTASAEIPFVFHFSYSLIYPLVPHSVFPCTMLIFALLIAKAKTTVGVTTCWIARSLTIATMVSRVFLHGHDGSFKHIGINNNYSSLLFMFEWNLYIILGRGGLLGCTRFNITYRISWAARYPYKALFLLSMQNIKGWGNVFTSFYLNNYLFHFRRNAPRRMSVWHLRVLASLQWPELRLSHNTLSIWLQQPRRMHLRTMRVSLRLRMWICSCSSAGFDSFGQICTTLFLFLISTFAFAFDWRAHCDPLTVSLPCPSHSHSVWFDMMYWEVDIYDIRAWTPKNPLAWILVPAISMLPVRAIFSMKKRGWLVTRPLEVFFLLSIFFFFSLSPLTSFILWFISCRK